jgi:hypothetical protein
MGHLAVRVMLAMGGFVEPYTSCSDRPRPAIRAPSSASLSRRSGAPCRAVDDRCSETLLRSELLSLASSAGEGLLLLTMQWTAAILVAPVQREELTWRSKPF